MTKKNERLGIPGHYPKRDYMLPSEELQKLSKETQELLSPGVPLLTASIEADRNGKIVVKQPKEGRCHARDGVLKAGGTNSSLLGEASHRSRLASKFQKSDSFSIV